MVEGQPQLRLRADAVAGLAVEDGRLIVEPQARLRYTPDELLAQCDPAAKPAREDRERLDAEPAGDELP